MNTDKTMVAKGFGGKNFPILNKGNQVARCEGEIGVPNRGPRAIKGWSQSWNIAKMQIVGESESHPRPSLDRGQTGEDVPSAGDGASPLKILNGLIGGMLYRIEACPRCEF
ncbi:hypothetical protein TNCV_1357931 [Trichonephila clavipes]|uniref:Uncharacterized protein n=1 Tax=Trichonephila clavipes TaxID=2585209 RepID=A0A8X6S6J9_TRICX|nr:hypothetical protein TNCV_1357931 [Trichonephila clavipes]